jgi:protein-S-isoprenylcysteine O-methyltransferase Ste14
MISALRLYFLGYYAIAVAIALITVGTDSLRSAPVERRADGAQRYLLPLGLALSLYTAAMEIWVWATLSRFLVPRAVIFEDHELITGGPYALLRHPDYSAILALWLGAGLGTLNGPLLLFFPLFLLGTWMEARVEERLLESQFGESYRTYARGRCRFIPRFRRRAA